MIYPWRAQIGRTAHKRHVLDVLGQDEWSGFKHQDAAAARYICNKEMFRDHAAKRATPNNDRIKVTLPPTDGLCSAIERLLQGNTLRSARIGEVGLTIGARLAVAGS